MNLRKPSRRQKFLLIALGGYAVSLAMALGMELGLLTSAYEMRSFSECWLEWALILAHGIFLIGLFRPEKRKKLLLLSVLLQCGLSWYWYGQLVGDVLYALMSFPINLIAEALLISYILSTKRGKILQICTVAFLIIRIFETALYLLQMNDGYFSSIWWIPVLAVVLARYGALVFMVFGLGTRGKTAPAEDIPRLDGKFLDSVERKELEKLCIFCGENRPYGEAVCKSCGKELKEEAALFENFPDESSLSPMLGNAYDSLKKQDWASAKESCEKAIENGENCPWAYIGMLLADLCYESFAELWNRPLRLELHGLWQKAMGAAEGETKERLKKIRRLCFNLSEQQRLEKQYLGALELRRAETAEDCVASAKGFARISGYRDAGEQAGLSLRLAQERIYHAAMEEERVENWSKAQQLYESIPEWEDAAQREEACQRMLERMESGLWNCGAGTKLGIGAACLVSALVFFLIFRI